MSSPSTNTLGKYQIIREIARSNDIVYEAVDPTINRRVALKELSVPVDAQGAQRRERVERFWREGKAAGRLSHPNIVTIFEVGKDGDRHFIAMEFLEGQTLRDMLQARGPLPIQDVKNYALQLCSALAYAHENSVIHRDIKPENVQILPGGHVKLTDFGIARLMGEPSITQNGQVFGTPSYMSPEQVAGKDLDPRSDIFSMGVLLYEMVAGHKPFTGDSVVTITYNIMNMEAPPPPGAPPWLAGVIRKAMAKDPAMRYSTAEEMAQDIRDETCSGGFALDSSGTGAWYPPFGGAQQQPSPLGTPPPSPFGTPSQPPPPGPMTPYGTPMPSPDPFSQAPPPTPMAPPAPPRPILSAETRNFLGVFLLVVGFAGMLVFAIWAVNLAYESYVTAQTSQSAARYYEQGNKLYERGDYAAASRQWSNAIRVSPDSEAAQQARKAIYNLSSTLAQQYYEARDAASLETQARALIEAGPRRPEGYFYLGAAYQLSGRLKEAKEQYELAIRYGGADAYAQAARRFLGHIYIIEGDQAASAGRRDDALAAYTKAIENGDSETMAAAQQKINALAGP